MTRYFFHFEDGQILIDEEGVELRGLEAAKMEAARYAAALLTDRPAEVWAGGTFTIRVLDDTARVRLVLDVITAEAPEAGWADD